MQLAAVLEAQGDLAALAARGADGLDAGADLDALGLERPADLLARELLLGGEDPRQRLDERDARAEAAEGLRHLDPDDAAAEDQQALGQRPPRSSPRGSSTGATSARPSIGGTAALVPVAITPPCAR